MTDSVPAAGPDPSDPPASRPWLALMLTAGAGWGARLIGAAAQFTAIRLLTRLLGLDGYGAFAVLASLTAWFALTDFGFGFSLQNHISNRRVAGERPVVAISSVALLLLASAGLVLLVIAATSGWVVPYLLGGFTNLPFFDARIGYLLFAALSVGAAVGAVALKICFAEHRGYIAHGLTAAAALIGLVGLVAITTMRVSHPFLWAIGLYYLPTAALPGLFLVIFLVRARTQTPGAPWLDRQVLIRLWRQARMMLLLAAVTAGVVNIDYLILSQTVPGEEVATYAVFGRLFGFIFLIWGSVLQAYWPVSAETFSRGEFGGLKRIVAYLVGSGTAIVMGCSLALALFLPAIGRALLSGQHGTLSPALIPFFAAYYLARVWADTFNTILSSAGHVLPLCCVLPIQACLSVLLGSWGATHYGIAGLMVALTLANLLTVSWALPTLLAFYLRRIRRDGARRDDFNGMAVQ